MKALIFGGGYIEKANKYIEDCSKRTGWPALYYSSPEQSAEEIEQKIKEYNGQINSNLFMSLVS